MDHSDKNLAWEVKERVSTTNNSIDQFGSLDSKNIFLYTKLKDAVTKFTSIIDAGHKQVHWGIFSLTFNEQNCRKFIVTPRDVMVQVLFNRLSSSVRYPLCEVLLNLHLINTINNQIIEYLLIF